MDRFKQFLLAEEFRKTETHFGIWLNPIEEEIKNIPGNTRAITLTNGDLLVGNLIDTVHSIILRESKKLYKDKNLKFPTKLFDKNSYSKSISLIRDGETKAFYVADDESSAIDKTFSGLETEQSRLDNKRKEILKKTKKKNRYWTFFNKVLGN